MPKRSSKVSAVYSTDLQHDRRWIYSVRVERESNGRLASAMRYDWMVRNSNGKKLALLRWHRYDLTQPAPEYECLSCHLKGHCHASEMCREVNAFGILIKQTRQIIECRHCSNEVVVGSMDLPTGKNMESNLGNFNLRNLSEDERVALRAVVGREVKLNYSDAADDQNAGVTN